MTDKSVIFSKSGHIGRITLNRPEAGNNIDFEMSQELAGVCQRINQEKDIYVVILTGTGEAFCRGGSIRELINLEDNNQLLLKLSPAEAMAGIECPTLASLNGDGLGVGLEIALACDLRLAADKAKFGLPQITQGTIPVNGGTQRLSRVVGKAKALEMVVTGEIIGAQEAFDIGLVNKLVKSEDLTSATDTLANTLASKAPLAARYCKEVVNKGLDLGLEQGLRLEADLYFLLHTTGDRTEGIQSYLQKKPPQFKGK
jgi:enoyl-CoA hydratase/carnithine racemase